MKEVDHILMYLNGELSRDETHEFEKKLLDDPFLSDAVEGWQMVESDSERRRLIQEFTELSPINKLQTGASPSNWWKIAASLVIVSLLSYLVYDQLEKINNPNDLQISENIEEPVLDEEIDREDMEESEGFYADSSSESSLEQPQIAETQVESINETEEQTPLVEADESIAIIEKQETEDLSQETSPVEIEITDDILEDNFDVAIAKEEGTEENEATKVRRSKKASSNPKANKVEAAPVAGRSLLMEERGDYPGPVGGYPAYEVYIRENINKPSIAIENGIGGDVTLEFIVTSDGEPQNILVLEGIGYGCDEEAIRLINEGPKWFPTSGNNRVSYTISF